MSVPTQAGEQEEGDWEERHMKTLLIQEYCDCGTLFKIAQAWQPAAEDDRQMLKRLLLLQDVVRGLEYLHEKNIVHGDLNARNVLVACNPKAVCGVSAKLADLGLSRTIKQHATHHTTCTVGTMSHMSPELLRYGRMSTAVDIYSLGVVMWELYMREVPFRELHYGQFFEMVVLRDRRPKVPVNMPDDYRLLMEQCWTTSPTDRPSACTVLKCINLMITDRQSCLQTVSTPLQLCLETKVSAGTSSTASVFTSPLSTASSGSRAAGVPGWSGAVGDLAQQQSRGSACSRDGTPPHSGSIKVSVKLADVLPDILPLSRTAPREGQGRSSSTSAGRGDSLAQGPHEQKEEQVQHSKDPGPTGDRQAGQATSRWFHDL
eukprot:gene12508-12642_t